MSEQVNPAPKAYQANVFWDRQDCATLSAQVYLASDADSYIDALRAEVEALRAENGRLITGLSHLAAVMAQHDETPEEINALALARDLMGATPAPEVPDHIAEASKMAEQGAVKVERDLMGTMHIKVGDFDAVQVRYQYPYTDNSSTKRLAERIADMLRNPLAEQGERQEAVAWTVAYPPEYKPFMHHLSFGSESEAARYAQQKTPKAMGCVVVALYTTPQPGPDVRGLVEALEHYAGCGKSGNVARVALAAHRQAQQGGSHDT